MTKIEIETITEAIKFNGSEKQKIWASNIIESTKLTNCQVDNLLRYAGPKMYTQGIMDATIIIENRRNLAEYADGLGKFYQLSTEEKHAVAKKTVDAIMADKITYIINRLT